MEKFQLYLTNDPAVLADCIAILERVFDVEVYQWYRNPEGNFKNFYGMKIRTNENKWDVARKIHEAHPGVIEVDPVRLLGQWGAYESDEDYPNPGEVNWNHNFTNFPKAVQRSIDEGRLISGQPAGVKIAHLDTGITQHPELPAFTETGYNFVEDNDSVFDQMAEGMLKHPGHGTGTASVVVGRKSDRLIDRNDGVFPYATLVPYRIAKSVVHILSSNIDEAVVHAVNKGVDVITMSMGGVTLNRSWLEAVRYAYKKGVIFCSAAGNNVGFVIWPAAYDEVIAVGAMNFNSNPWEGSCRGPKVEISAPGENVYVARAYKKEDGFVYDQGFGSGTSHATPHIASAAALWLNHFRQELSEVITAPHQKVDLFRKALRLSAKAHINPAYCQEYGVGVLDAYKLLDFSPRVLMDMDGGTVAPVTASHRGSGRGVGDKDQVMSLTQKEMLDLMYNERYESYDKMVEAIKNEGSREARIKFDALYPEADTMNIATEAADGGSGRGIGKAQLKEARKLFAGMIIDNQI